MKDLEYPTILILRHDKTAWNTGSDQDKIKGVKYDLPLTTEGQAKARKDADIIAQFPVSSIRHSPMLRSRQSAKPLGEATSIKPVEDEGLKPWDDGFVAGMTREAAGPILEYYIKHPKRAIRGGIPYEDYNDVITGVVASEMAKAEKSPDKLRVLITHSDGIQAIKGFVENRQAQVHVESNNPPAGSISALEKRGGKWTIRHDFAA